LIAHSAFRLARPVSQLRLPFRDWQPGSQLAVSDLESIQRDCCDLRLTVNLAKLQRLSEASLA